MRQPRKTSPSGTTPSVRVRGPGAPATERSDQVQSLVRALTIVNRLADSDEGVSLTEVAQQVGLSASTAHRLLTTLEQERYVHYDAERRLWSVGVQAFMTGNAFLKTRNLVTLARPHMRALMEASEETVNLAVEDHQNPPPLLSVLLSPFSVFSFESESSSLSGLTIPELAKLEDPESLGGILRNFD